MVGTVLKFLHLGRAISIITDFIAEESAAGLFQIPPTLSPKDPNFENWYPSYENPLKTLHNPQPEGQEPFDN